LSEEERYKINEHIVQTLVMLSQLPFPKHLRQCRKSPVLTTRRWMAAAIRAQLRREEMSPLARMMAIADIFEALTAIDRPYKKGKTLSEALAIMSRMQQEQHIDGDLFALFLRSGVHLEYARQFMQPDADVDAPRFARVPRRRHRAVRPKRPDPDWRSFPMRNTVRILYSQRPLTGKSTDPHELSR
jgi:hypothetical protein